MFCYILELASKLQLASDPNILVPFPVWIQAAVQAAHSATYGMVKIRRDEVCTCWLHAALHLQHRKKQFSEQSHISLLLKLCNV